MRLFDVEAVADHKFTGFAKSRIPPRNRGFQTVCAKPGVLTKATDAHLAEASNHVYQLGLGPAGAGRDEEQEES
jgi:hypothetical protein